MTTKLTVGVDGGALSIADDRLKVGVYRMTAGIVNALLDRSDIATVRLYGFGPMVLDDVRGMHGNLEPCMIVPSWGYSRVRLPVELASHPVDCFVGASQSLPPFIRIPTVGCVYDVSFLTDPQSYPGSLRRLTAQTADVVSRATRILTISRASRDAIVNRYGTDPGKIAVAYPGIEDVFRLPGPAMKRDRPYVLYVGSLKRGKRIPELLRSFSRAVSLMKGAPLDLVLVGGDYWRDPDIDGTISSLGISQRIVMTGYADDTAVASYYRGAAAFVSLSQGEGFCIPAAEALACGCPVIGVGSGAMPESVGDGGVVVEPGDEGAVAGEIYRYVTDSGKRDAAGKRGVAYAKRFTWSAFADILGDTVLSAVSR